ncbi:hypothetical protein Tco_0856857 [Tanacetum coccineum]|uniref:Uncharacterized protein n=1 Tax=Tanacetum coccineum TaxID=301880 RepID=A0ABQ5B4P0_9ASTR
MAPMAFVPKHNHVGFLKKPKGSAGHDENQGEPQEEPVESQPPPNASVPSTSQPITKPYPDQELETKTELHGSSSDFVHTPTQVETSSPELKSISPEPMKHTYDQP